MKTTKKWSKMLLAGMSALVLTFGLLVVGCDDGGDDNPPAQGTLTITNITGYDGKYVSVSASDAENTIFISSMDTTSTKFYSVTVAGGTAVVPLNATTDKKTLFAYTGSDTLQVGVDLTETINESGGDDMAASVYWTYVKFTGGNATVNWNDATIPY
ncbi:hypothetical protein FACS1894102_6030 [Spirochaetia bacterium]|nr:hypothetical protein FACS1894102_6030 [Spirochaetia bacterium]